MLDNSHRPRLRRDWRAFRRERWVDARVRRRVHQLLEAGRGEDWGSTAVDAALVVLILVNVIAFVLETVPSIEARYGLLLSGIEIVSVAVFTVEYVLRVWSSVEEPFLKRYPPNKARMVFALRPFLIIDLLAILPFYLGALLPIDLRILRAFRLMRFLKLGRYSPAMHTLVRVLQNERRALTGALLLVLTALLFASTGMYYLEHDAQPDRFGSIPESAWWAIVTLTTVGYGDVTPITPLGRLFAGMVMLCGLVVLALPIAIIATGFSQEVGRRDFVLTWSMLSKIPLFADLDSHAVVELMRYLHAHNFPAGWEVVQEGAQADAMYFIASGKVRQGSTENCEVLGTGDFFGEHEMLEHGVHHVGITTQSRTRVLKLHRDDFHRLANSHPNIVQHIRQVSAKRRGVEAPAES